MTQRCYDPNEPRYRNYGGRGIRICDSWKKDQWEFIAWAYEAGWRPGLSIERKDVNGPYAPWNCEWIPTADQSLNKTWNKQAFRESKNLVQWSKDPRCMVTYRSLKDRLQRGWSLEEAISTPPMDRTTRGKLAMEKRWHG